MGVEDCINLEDLKRLAKRRVPKLIFDFIEGGVDDERGLDVNVEAFARRALAPRYMSGVSAVDQSTELFGRTYASAYGVAPMGGIGNYRRGGDMMLARAAEAANVPFILSGAATASTEDLVRHAPNVGWQQIYTAKDRAIAEAQIGKAAELGVPVLVVTVDVPVSPNRERNRRNGFGRPLKLSMRTKLDALRRPLWLNDYLRHGLAMLPNWQPFAPAGADAEAVGEFVADQLPTSITWTDIERFREIWPRAFVLKGVMRTDDARRAAEIGVDGLIVSNHGGRQLDRAASPLDALAQIDAAVGDRMTLMLDGGVRRGSDVVTALASGAKAVFLGRPALYGAIAGGDAGASKALHIVSDEINRVMVQMGCPALADVGPDCLFDDLSQDRRNARA